MRSCLLVPLVVALGCGANTVVANGPRDPRWAAPLSQPGLPNLHQVSSTLYRGAQPEVPKPRVLRHNLRAPALPSGERSIRRPDGW